MWISICDEPIPTFGNNGQKFLLNLFFEPQYGRNESYPTTVEVLYAKDENPGWAITADDFFDFFYKAIDDEYLRDLMWRVMVDRDCEAKDEYNKLGNGKIGGYDFMYN